MKCSATAEDGMPCLAEAWGDSIYCLMHDPSPSARRRHGEMSRRGGTSSRATAIGFSMKMCALASTARRAVSVWRCGGVQMNTASGPLASAASNDFAAATFWRDANSRARSVAGS